MPWTGRSAKKHTKKATTPAKKRQWATVANSMLQQGASEGSAVRAANAAVSRGKGKSGRSSTRRTRK